MTPFTELRELFTPRESRYHEPRLSMLISPKDKAKIGRGAWTADVTDLITGITYTVAGAECGLGCHCDAIIKQRLGCHPMTMPLDDEDTAYTVLGEVSEGIVVELEAFFDDLNPEVFVSYDKENAEHAFMITTGTFIVSLEAYIRERTGLDLEVMMGESGAQAEGCAFFEASNRAEREAA